MSDKVLIEEREIGNKKVRIWSSYEEPENPREDEVNIGKMIFFHKKDTIGDEHDYVDKDEFIYNLARKVFKEKVLDEKIKKINEESPSEEKADDKILASISDKYIVRKVYLYQHGGMTISLRPFHCRWDSGVVGWIYVDKKKAEKVYKLLGSDAKKVISLEEWISERIETEIKAYDDYLQGKGGSEEYSYELLENDETIDECWGFYSIREVHEDLCHILNLEDLETTEGSVVV